MYHIITLTPPPPNFVGSPEPFRFSGTFLFSFQFNYSANYTHKSSAGGVTGVSADYCSSAGPGLPQANRNKNFGRNTRSAELIRGS